MGKRTKDKSDEEIRKKIRKLEEELRDRENVPPNRRQTQDREYYDYCSSVYNYREELELDAYGSVASICGDGGHSEEEYSVECPPAMSHVADKDCERQRDDVPATTEEVDDIDLQQPPTQVPDPVIKPVAEVETNITSPTQDKEDSLPTEILAILGEAKRSSESFGKKIPCDISERWGQILLEGLAKEQKEMLIAKMLIPENFQLAKAPKLNPEVASVITDPAKNRDKRLEKMQSQLGSGISGIVELTVDLICKDINKIDIIKRLSEINQILLDLHYEETMNRRRLIIPMLDKKFISIIQGVKRDEFLFGDKLGDNIKASKSIEQSSLQIKKSAPPPPSTSRKPAGQQGNSRVPPRAGGGSAPARAPAPYRYGGYGYPPPPPPAARRPPPPPRRSQPPPSSSRSQDRRSRR